MHCACQDCMAFCFWHKIVACSSLFGKWTHLGNGTFQACVCLQYAWNMYCPNTPHDSCRNNNFFLPEEHSQKHIISSQKRWLGRTSGVHPAALLPALGQVSYTFSNGVFRTHSKDEDFTTTLIRLSNCFPNAILNLSEHNLWPLPLLQLSISHFQEILDSVVFLIPIGIAVGYYFITSWCSFHPRHLSISLR